MQDYAQLCREVQGIDGNILSVAAIKENSVLAMATLKSLIPPSEQETRDMLDGFPRLLQAARSGESYMGELRYLVVHFFKHDVIIFPSFSEDRSVSMVLTVKGSDNHSPIIRKFSIYLMDRDSRN
jgi:hypothetical protein